MGESPLRGLDERRQFANRGTCHGAHALQRLGERHPRIEQPVGLLQRHDLLLREAGAAQALWHYTLIRARAREGCFKAFRLNHWIGAALFAGAALDLALR